MTDPIAMLRYGKRPGEPGRALIQTVKLNCKLTSPTGQ
jgi:hypothetical protein